MPLTLFGLVRKVSGFHQCWLAILSALVFGVGLAPLEVQRRIINAAVAGGSVRILVLLAAAYFGLGIAEGLLKLGMNVYRGWVSESAVRWLRTSIASLSRSHSRDQPGTKATGTEIAMTLSEWEQGQREPSGAAAVLLWLLNKIPDEILRVMKKG